jgi:hypothetical protein
VWYLHSHKFDKKAPTFRGHHGHGRKFRNTGYDVIFLSRQVEYDRWTFKQGLWKRLISLSAELFLVSEMATLAICKHCVLCSCVLGFLVKDLNSFRD